jgi:hypothetical protein
VSASAGAPTRFFEPSPGEAFDPRAVATQCIESGSRALLLGVEAVPPEFFDLSTGVAGELLHRLSMYGIRLAAIVPDPSAHSPAFQDFAREANRGRQFRFFPTRPEAIAWLET